MSKSLRAARDEAVKPRFLLVGEGPHDVGRDGSPGGALAGFLTAIVRAAGPALNTQDLPFEPSAIKYWKDLPLQGPRRRFADLTRAGADGRRVRAAMLLAADLDGVVIIRDCEQRDAIDRGVQLREGRDEYRRNDPEAANLACVIAAPSRCHETWLLADADAVRTVLGPQAVFLFSGDPEDRPACDELKSHIERHSRRRTSLRAELAFQARPSVLRRRCVRCYPAFVQDVETELARWFPQIAE